MTNDEPDWEGFARAVVGDWPVEDIEGTELFDWAIEEVAKTRADALMEGYLVGFTMAGEGYNGELPFAVNGTDPEDDPYWCRARENALAGLIPDTSNARSAKSAPEATPPTTKRTPDMAETSTRHNGGPAWPDHMDPQEVRICDRLISQILGSGYAILVHDGEEPATEVTTDRSKIQAATAATDLTMYQIYQNTPGHSCVAIIYLIHGNGADVVHDTSCFSPGPELDMWIENALKGED